MPDWGSAGFSVKTTGTLSVAGPGILVHFRVLVRPNSSLAMAKLIPVYNTSPLLTPDLTLLAIGGWRE